MLPEVGQIVNSLNGRDKGKLLIVVKCEENFVFLCDGRERPLTRPKKKSLKHVEILNVVYNEQLETNKKIRHAIKNFIEQSKRR